MKKNLEPVIKENVLEVLGRLVSDTKKLEQQVKENRLDDLSIAFTQIESHCQNAKYLLRQAIQGRLPF